MKFMLMQSLDLIYTKNLSVRKNVANKIATIGGFFARCNRSGLEASNKKQPGASFSCFEKYPQELYRSVCRLANGVLWQMTRVSIYLHVCLGKISCKFLYSKQKAAKRKGRSAVLETALLIMEVFPKGLLGEPCLSQGREETDCFVLHLSGASQCPTDKSRKTSSSQQ